MKNKAQIDPRALAELIAQLGRSGHGEGLQSGLTPVQWTALRYFARANRFSRTISAFAEYHATTRGTVSQMIKSLVAQGYLTRTRSDQDGRSRRLDLTAKARGALADDPFEALVRAADAEAAGARRQLDRTLRRMLRHVARARGARPFGTCPSCEHIREDGRCPEGRSPYSCGLFLAPLTRAELDQLCVNFEPASSGGALP